MKSEPFLRLLEGRGAACSCLSLADGLRERLDGIERHLCAEHDADAIVRRDAEAARDIERERGRVLREAWADSKPPGPACTCLDVAATVREILAGTGPTRCELHEAEPAPMSTIAIGNAREVLRTLSNALSGATTFTDFTGGDAA